MQDYSVEVFYDGECPLCLREINMLRRLDRKQRIRFSDITAADFDAEALGTTYAALMQRIQARLPSGEWISGVEVFRQLYAAVGFGPVVALTRLPGLRQGLDYAYGRFAENRLKWTGRCTPDGCAIPRPPEAERPDLGADDARRTAEV